MTLTYDAAEAARVLRKADKQLARIIQRAGACSLCPEKMQSPFQALMKAIVYQQLSGKAAATILSRLLVQLPKKGSEQPRAIAGLPDEVFRAAGISRPKIASLRDLAAKTIDGTVPTLAQLKKMDDDEIVERLTQVRGIGIWTVQMLLIFRLGRPDVLPTNDLGVRKGFMLTYGTAALPTPLELASYGDVWRPYRSVASWYLWRAVDMKY